MINDRDLEVVKVKHENGGYSYINASDFDPEIHELYNEDDETNQDLEKLNKDEVPEQQKPRNGGKRTGNKKDETVSGK